jgi:hypothetical protein
MINYLFTKFLPHEWRIRGSKQDDREATDFLPGDPVEIEPPTTIDCKRDDDWEPACLFFDIPNPTAADVVQMANLRVKTYLNSKNLLFEQGNK